MGPKKNPWAAQDEPEPLVIEKFSSSAITQHSKHILQSSSEENGTTPQIVV